MPRIPAYPTYPSTTEVLQAVGLSQSYRGMSEDYALRGKALHETIAWYLAGELDLDSVHPEIRGGFDAFLEFEEQADYRSIETELELVHPYGFVGHIDLLGSVGSVERAILDTKFTDSPDLKGATFQLASYRMLHNHAYPETPAQQCYVLQLSKSGRYRLHPVLDDYAMTIFTSALIVFNAREGKR